MKIEDLTIGEVREIMNNTLTASRMNTLATCPRKHYWSNEIGLHSKDKPLALRFGSAYARGMQAYWLGLPYHVDGDGPSMLTYAIPEGVDLDPYACSTVAALLAGYYDYYGPAKKFGKMLPEEQFQSMLVEGFEVKGKIDSLGQLTDNRSVLIEAKTASDSLDADSEYWLRLNFNLQILQYWDAANAAGWDISTVLYDVTRKPMIRPKQIVDLDADGLKIVKDREGNRVYETKKIKVEKQVKIPVVNKKTKKPVKGKFTIETKTVTEEKQAPRQSASEAEGYVVSTHLETPDEFCDRLWKDTQARPEFYYKRREIPILESDVQQFRLQRIAYIKMILAFRENEQELEHAEDAHPRHVRMDTCRFCEYKSFCLHNIRVDINNPPTGFEIQPFNPELKENYESTTETDNGGAAA